MEFELLPNEILIQCFEYLNAFDIFYSFEQLNSRFNTLIQTIFLHLNFQHVQKSMFDQFCRKMYLNSNIKKQISSLKLSNESDTCCQIKTFLSLFSLVEFTHLRSLTLIDVKYEEEEVKKIQLMLPYLSNLRYFYLNSEKNISYKILNSLPLLTIRTLFSNFLSFQKLTSIINLTIFSCDSLNNLFQLFKYVPRLKYLNINILSSDYNITDNDDIQVIYLTTLVVKVDSVKFNFIEILLKKMSNLKNLSLISFNSKEILDTCRWERLICQSLSHLNNFKFLFHTIFEDQIESSWLFIEIFDKFQTNFWHKEHHWYTAYEFDKDSGIIYTIPYISDTYKLTMFTNRYCERNSNVFNNVINLTLSTGTLKKDFQHYFSNIKSLILHNAYNLLDDPKQEIGHIKSLQIIVNLSTVVHLDMGPTWRNETSLILLKILKETPQLSSLRIDASTLIILSYNDELCDYLNRMIRKLDVVKYNDHLSISPNIIEKFCRIFSNLEQLRFPIQRVDDLSMFLNQLSKLLNLTVRYQFFLFNANQWLQENAKIFNRNFLFEYVDDDQDFSFRLLHIWTDELQVLDTGKHF